MRESIGNAFILNIVVIFLFLIMLIFVGSISYSKAFKLKNRMINVIEENRGYNSTAQAEIQTFLSEVGYQIGEGNTKCKNHGGTQIYPVSNTGHYEYCVVQYDHKKGTYYGVTTIMKFHFPIIGDFLEFAVYGETKTFGGLE